MTWILPRQLHTSACALDTEALISDLEESSRICGQSLFVKSKPMQSLTWLRKWKQDSWTRHLSGRILKPSLGQHFAIAWTSSLADTHVSHSHPQEDATEHRTRATSGHTSQMELPFPDPDCASLRTSRDISAWGCPTSSKTWQEWVTERRGAYSRRLKSALLTRGNGSSFWPTPTASEDKDQNASFGTLARLDKGGRILRRIATLTVGQASRENHNTIGNLRRQLNPRWVEALMGLPMHWVNSSGFSGTESSQPQQH